MSYTKLEISVAIARAKAETPELLSKGMSPLVVTETAARARQVGIDHPEIIAVPMERYISQNLKDTWGGPIYIGLEEKEEKNEKETTDSGHAAKNKRNTYGRRN